MTHEDDKEDYSVVQARIPLTGFVFTREAEQELSSVPLWTRILTVCLRRGTPCQPHCFLG